MPDVIEPAKTGRSSCNKCKEKILKGELRFGKEYPLDSSGHMGVRWYHLKCGAAVEPYGVEALLAETSVSGPDRKEIDAVIAEAKGDYKPALPYAHRSPNNRAKCMVCDEKIEKDTLRVAVEREMDAGGFTRTGAGYLHLECTPQWEDGIALLDKVKSTIGLSKEDVEAIEKVLAENK